MFNCQIEHSSLLNTVIQIKGNNYFRRMSFVESIQGTFFINTNLRYRRMFLDFCHRWNIWLREESIKIMQRSSFQWIFSWKWKHVYLCNIKCFTSHVVSGFIGTGYLLSGKNYLVIFILINIFYLFNTFYSIIHMFQPPCSERETPVLRETCPNFQFFCKIPNMYCKLLCLLVFELRNCCW